MANPDEFKVDFPLRAFVPERLGARSVDEPARKIPVLTDCDLAVFGGGPAGVCAAAAAARSGKRVVLVEHYGFLGGMATAANVNMLHSLYGTDGKTRIIGGLSEEIIRRLQQRGAARNYAPDGQTGPWAVCSETAKFVFDDMMVASGVKLLLHTSFADVLRDGRRIKAAVIEGKSGREAVVASVYIDCTGDADLVRRAGLETQFGDAAGRCQPPSLCFRLAGIKPDAAKESAIQDELAKTLMDYNGQKYSNFLWSTAGIWDSGEMMLSGVRVPRIDAADTLDLTRAEIEGRYQLRWLMDRLKTMLGWEDAHLVDIATQIGVRETHRIIADHQLTREEVLEGVSFEDTVAQGTYPIDIHNPDGLGIRFERLDGGWKRINDDGSVEQGRWDGRPEGSQPRDTLCYQVPYRCLIPRDLDNVLAAGRCCGTDHESTGAIRVMINCMQLGQAAGTAAAMTARDGDVRKIDGPTLRKNLIAAGVPLQPV
ncbi:MAG: FAD-dependent oxidoreductase [Planctomycetota bacterium]|nr:FAD-dependent oxidoreductase [Planctomycetota bacterium]